jgi:hypothetical protein
MMGIVTNFIFWTGSALTLIMRLGNNIEFSKGIWTVRSSWKINEFTRVSAPNAPQPSSRLTITERLSMQGF